MQAKFPHFQRIERIRPTRESFVGDVCDDVSDDVSNALCNYLHKRNPEVSNGEMDLCFKAIFCFII